MNDRVSTLEKLLEGKNDQITDLGAKKESLERKCIRLREYIKRLTKKCEEWTCSYREQQTCLKEVKDENQRAVFEILALSNKLKSFESDREVWNNEMKILESKTHDLEAELVGIQDMPEDKNGNKVICQECKYLRKAVASESAKVSRLKKLIDTKDSEVGSMSIKSKVRSLFYYFVCNCLYKFYI